MGIGKGYAKVILFGEHFVVYGLPGVASGIKSLYTEAKIKKIDSGIILKDNVFKHIKDLIKDTDYINTKIMKPVIDKLGIDGVEITLDSMLIPEHGMGYSAAFAVAIINALNDEYRFGFTNDDINKFAYECEKVSHGTPSGIDNTCATYGTLIHFEKNMQGGQNKIQLLKLSRAHYLVYGDSGKKGSTKETVAAVRKRKEENPVLFEKIFNEYKKIAVIGEKALIDGNLKKVGLMMSKNHELLIKIGVSIPELDKLCKLALDNGALGAKVTGGGGGGMMIALAENESSQNKIYDAFKKNGFGAIKIKLE